MADFLSEDWFAAVAQLTGSLPDVSGSGSVDLAVTTAPRKETHLHWSYDGGVPGAGATGPAEEPDLALTISPADAVDLLAGGIDPSVAFMRGRLKAAGDQNLLLAFLSSTSGERWESWRQEAASLGLPERAN